MAVAFDAATTSFRAASAGDPWAFNHTPSGTPRGVVLCYAQQLAETDFVSSVTYGGVAMTPVVAAENGAGDEGRAAIFFLGASVPTGTQSVSIDLTSNINRPQQFALISLTGDDDLEVIDFDSVASSSLDDPSLTMNHGARTAMAIGALFQGAGAVSSITPAGSMSQIVEVDFGSDVAGIYYQTTPDDGDYAYTITTNSAQSVAMAVASIAEVEAVATWLPRSVIL